VGGRLIAPRYEVKLQNGLECGGAYLKLLTESPEGIQAQEFSDKTPYTVMFGPDKCGATNKVHFIFRHKNPVSGEYEEKHLTSAPSARISKLSTLYTLIVRPDQTFEIKINEEHVKSGSLLEDFDPPVNPSEEIDDPEDKKPEDWVDTAKIPDPEATKPEDWDEDAPREILDAEAEKPEDWLDNEPELIPDPDAEKPDDWDDEEDGDWVAPTIANPKCVEASGCGEWIRPMTKNPAYKGKWSAPLMDNPAYKGPWSPRRIPNPNHFHDASPSIFEPMAGIGFELWTMQNDILFDNIYIGHSEKDAAKFAKETWGKKYPAERTLEDKEKPKAKEPFESSWRDDPVGFVTTQIARFFELASFDVKQAFMVHPVTGAGLIVFGVTIIALAGGIMSLILAPVSTQLSPAAPLSWDLFSWSLMADG
jgi:calnexin